MAVTDVFFDNPVDRNRCMSCEPVREAGVGPEARPVVGFATRGAGAGHRGPAAGAGRTGRCAPEASARRDQSVNSSTPAVRSGHRLGNGSRVPDLFEGFDPGSE